jgi:hypothetical protein
MLKAALNLNERFSCFRNKNPETDPVKPESRVTNIKHGTLFRTE